MYPLHKGKRTKGVSGGMGKYKNVFKGRGHQIQSGIVMDIKKVDRSSGRLGIRQRQRLVRLNIKKREKDLYLLDRQRLN